jgi:transposase-like protein
MNKNSLIELYSEKNATLIAQDYNIRPSYVQHQLRLHKIPKLLRDKTGKAVDQDLIKDYHAQGKSLKEIANLVNASLDCISFVLFKEKTLPNPNDIAKDFNLGMSKLGLSIKYSISVYELDKILYQHNLIENDFKISKDQLQHDYESLTIKEIAIKYGVKNICVSQKLREYSLIKDINKEELIRLYCEERMSFNDLAKYFNSSQTTIYRMLRKYKIQRFFEPEKEEFLRLYQDKTKTSANVLKEMAYHYGVSTYQIRLAYQRLENKRKRTAIKIKYTKEQLEALYKEHGIKGLSIQIGISEQNIKRALIKNGIYVEKQKKVLDLDKDHVSHLYKTRHLEWKAKYVIEEIAQELNVKPSVLYNFIRAHGITR